MIDDGGIGFGRPDKDQGVDVALCKRGASTRQASSLMFQTGSGRPCPEAHGPVLQVRSGKVAVQRNEKTIS
jgi:hypothetical protein